MSDTVPVIIKVESAAAALADAARRARIGRLVGVMDAVSVEAEGQGFTDDILEAELAACNAERPDAPLTE